MAQTLTIYLVNQAPGAAEAAPPVPPTRARVTAVASSALNRRDVRVMRTFPLLQRERPGPDPVATAAIHDSV